MSDENFNRNYYDEDDDVIRTSNLSSDNKDLEIEYNIAKNKLIHKTDTSGYNSFDYKLMSPEEAENEWAEVRANARFANQGFSDVVEHVEKEIKRPINYKEFDILCQEYAKNAAFKEAKLKAGRFVEDEEIQVNPARINTYYSMLLENVPLQSAYKREMGAFEDTYVSSIGKLLDEQMQKAPQTVEIDISRGKRVNIRHKGKVKIIGIDHNNKYIQINNDSDVKLLHMKYRQEWLDKKHPDMVKDGKVILDESREEREFE